MHCLANDRCKRCNVTFNNRQSASCSAAACSLVRHYLPPAPGPWAAGTAVGTAGSCGNLRPRAIVMIEHWVAVSSAARAESLSPSQRSAPPGAPCRRQLRGEVHAAAAATAAPTEITRVQTGAHTASCFFVLLHKPIQTGLECWRRGAGSRRKGAAPADACCCKPQRGGTKATTERKRGRRGRHTHKREANNILVLTRW